MSNAPEVLFAGESWYTHSTHIKGFDSFEESSYHEGGTHLIKALTEGGVAVTYQPSHIAASHFPVTLDDLRKYDVVALSDIGANTLLLPHRTFISAQRTANRLDLIRAFVESGGGLLMIGGYLTFQGIGAKGNWHGTVIDEILPIRLLPGDDRVEQPQGVVPTTNDAKHPVVAGLSPWPHFLGYNRSLLRPEAHLVASVGEDPFLAVRSVDNGRTAIFASDCGPHWGPPDFLSWDSYGKLWLNLVSWLAKR